MRASCSIKVKTHRRGEPPACGFLAFRMPIVVQRRIIYRGRSKRVLTA